MIKNRLHIYMYLYIYINIYIYIYIYMQKERFNRDIIVIRLYIEKWMNGKGALDKHGRGKNR